MTNRSDLIPRQGKACETRLFSHFSRLRFGCHVDLSVTFENDFGTWGMEMAWDGNWAVAEQLQFDSICQSSLKLGDWRGKFDLSQRWSDYPETKAGVKSVWSDSLKWSGISGEDREERWFMMRLVLVRSGRWDFFSNHITSFASSVHFVIWLSVIREVVVAEIQICITKVFLCGINFTFKRNHF